MSSKTQQPPQTSMAFADRVELSEDGYRAMLAGITLVAACVRFWQLGNRGLIIDEGYSWAIARTPLHHFLHDLVTNTSEMPLHYIALRYWSLLGTSEFVMRSLSVLFAIATVPVIAEIGKRLYSRHAGLFAAAFFAVQVVAVKFSQEIRTYPMLMFFAALGWLQLTRVVRNPSRRNWFWFSVVTVATIYSHLVGGLNLAAQFVTLLFLPASRFAWRKLGESLLTVFLGIFPAIVFTLHHTADVAWIHPTDLIILREFAANLAGRFDLAMLAVLPWLAFLMVTVLFVITWRRAGRGQDLWAASVPVLGTTVPFLLLLAVSHFKPLFIPRYIAYVLIPFLVGLGWLCSRLKPVMASGLAVAVVAVFAGRLPSYYREPAWMDFRGGVAYVASRNQPGDGLVVWEPMARPAVEYYGSRVPGFPDFIFPKSGDRFHAEDMFMRPDPYRLPAVFAERRRIWIIFDLDKPAAEYNIVPPLYFERVIGRTHKQVSFRQLNNVRVEEFVLR